MLNHGLTRRYILCQARAQWASPGLAQAGNSGESLIYPRSCGDECAHCWAAPIGPSIYPGASQEVDAGGQRFTRRTPRLFYYPLGIVPGASEGGRD